MAGKKVSEKVEEVVEKEVVDNSKELELLKQIEELKKQLEKKEEKEEVVEIAHNKRVEIIHLMYGTTPMEVGKITKNFNNFMEKQNVTFEWLQEARYHEKYARFFENLGIYIKDKEVREALDLDYSKYKVEDKDFLESILSEEEAVKMELRINLLPEIAKESFRDYFFYKYVEDNDPRTLDVRKIDVINRLFGVNIQQVASEYKSVGK